MDQVVATETKVNSGGESAKRVYGAENAINELAIKLKNKEQVNGLNEVLRNFKSGDENFAEICRNVDQKEMRDLYNKVVGGIVYMAMEEAGGEVQADIETGSLQAIEKYFPPKDIDPQILKAARSNVVSQPVGEVIDEFYEAPVTVDNLNKFISELKNVSGVDLTDEDLDRIDATIVEAQVKIKEMTETPKTEPKIETTVAEIEEEKPFSWIETYLEYADKRDGVVKPKPEETKLLTAGKEPKVDSWYEEVKPPETKPIEVKEVPVKSEPVAEQQGEIKLLTGKVETPKVENPDLNPSVASSATSPLENGSEQKQPNSDLNLPADKKSEAIGQIGPLGPIEKTEVVEKQPIPVTIIGLDGKKDDSWVYEKDDGLGHIAVSKVIGDIKVERSMYKIIFEENNPGLYDKIQAEGKNTLVDMSTIVNTDFVRIIEKGKDDWSISVDIGDDGMITSVVKKEGGGSDFIKNPRSFFDEKYPGLLDGIGLVDVNKQSAVAEALADKVVEELPKDVEETGVIVPDEKPKGRLQKFLDRLRGKP